MKVNKYQKCFACSGTGFYKIPEKKLLRKEIVLLREQGLTYRQIGQIVNKAYSVVAYHIRKSKLQIK